MPEVLGNAGLYFDPENPEEIMQAIQKFIFSPKLREEKAKASVERGGQYSWERCADETFLFIAQIARQSVKL
jgi:glycosyltransferase involved in cell wall biosynthesis